MENLKPILESLLFVAEEALSLERLAKLVTEADSREIRQALEELRHEYDQRPAGFYLAEVAGGYQLRSRPEFTTWIRRLVDPKPVRLSKAALETLAIIAYKQPVIRADVEHIRGVDCGGVLRVLLERKLVRVLGRKEIAGRPLIYATTKKFLETFDLRDLKDLPSPKEIEEFGQPPLEARGRITIEPEPEPEPEASEPPETPEEAAPGFAELPVVSAAEDFEDAAPAPEAEDGESVPAEPPPEKTLDFDPEKT
jgi:segregation and condensation protein B